MKSKGAERNRKLDHQREARKRPAVSAAPAVTQYPSNFPPPPPTSPQPHDQLQGEGHSSKPSSSHNPHPSSTSSKPAYSALPTACAGCRFQRRRCLEQCELAPYFPAHEDVEFEAVHGLFGVKNFVNLLKSISSPELRHVAASTMKAEARLRQMDPVLGAAGIIRNLQDRIKVYEEELLKAQTVLVALRHQQLYQMQVSAHPDQVFQNSSHSAPAYYSAASSQTQCSILDKSLSLDDLGCSTSSRTRINACEHADLSRPDNCDSCFRNLIDSGQISAGFSNLDISSRGNVIGPSMDIHSQSISFNSEDIIRSPCSQCLADQFASSQNFINSYGNLPSTTSTSPYYGNVGLDGPGTSSNALLVRLPTDTCDKSNQLNCPTFFDDVG